MLLMQFNKVNSQVLHWGGGAVGIGTRWRLRGERAAPWRRTQRRNTEVPSEQQETLFHCTRGRALQVTQGAGGVSIL